MVGIKRLVYHLYIYGGKLINNVNSSILVEPRNVNKNKFTNYYIVLMY